MEQEAGPARGYVLIAEDNPTDATVVKAALEGQGWYVAMAEDAMQAVMLARKDPPDALILDIQMPGGWGTKALARLRSMPETTHVAVFIVSGIDPAQVEDEVAEHGVSGWFSKPVDLAALTEALAALDVEARETPPDLSPTKLDMVGVGEGTSGGGLKSQATGRLVRKLVRGRPLAP